MDVYLDNAATTPLDPAVVEAMLPLMRDHFGNPSSIHRRGRQVRAAVEQARRQVAECLGASPAEICFTSGGTEADNAALTGAVRGLGYRRAITSRLEHHAVLHCLEALAAREEITLHYLEHDAAGFPDLDHLASLLRDQPPTLVSLMHGNNEVGNLNDLTAIGELCHEHGAIFHSDTVQTLGHYPLDLSALPVDYIVGSAHKLHGPKGVGLLYVQPGRALPPLLRGGSQERNQRGGTENVYGIVGFAKALTLATEGVEAHRQHVLGLKRRLGDQLRERLPGVKFNGGSADLERSLYTVLSVSLPPSDAGEMLLFNLDIQGICASGGSACSSGSSAGSHVLDALRADPARGAVRFSFSKFNTAAEIDYVVDQLVALCQPQQV